MLDISFYKASGELADTWESDEMPDATAIMRMMGGRRGRLEIVDRDIGTVVASKEIEKDMSASDLLKQARYIAGISQQQCADITGIPIRQIKAYECGDRKPPDWMVDILCDYILIKARYQQTGKKR